MKRFLFSLALLLLIAGCVPLGPTPTETAVPAVSETSPIAMATETETPLPLATSTMVPPAPVLPAPIYYLFAEDGQPQALYRLEEDGKTATRITNEPKAVSDFSVNPKSGALIYISDNALFIANADGSNARKLIEGKQGEETEEFIIKEKIGRPFWSPDGKFIAYSLGGLRLFDIDKYQDALLLEHQVESLPSGGSVIRELYAPLKWNSDGSMLAINIGYYEGSNIAVYDLPGKQLIQPRSEQPLCCQASWSSDGQQLYISSPFMGMVDPGLWMMDIATGAVKTIAEIKPGTDYPFVGWIAEADGELVYFYNAFNHEPAPGPVLLSPYRSPLADFAARKQLSNAGFALRELLWTPDHSLAVGLGDSKAIYGENLILISTAGQPAVILPFKGSFIAWGKPK